MNILVTGGAGFIGSHLVDRLIELNHSVTVIDNESADYHDNFYWNDKANNYKYDVCNYDQIFPLFKDIDYVFHLASDARIQPSIANPSKSVHTNSIGTTNVLEASRQNNVKLVIYTSSSSIYGRNSIPNHESQGSDCLTPYSASKLLGENLCKVYTNLYGLNTLYLRYFNVYGDRQPIKGKYATVIGLFLKQYKNDEPLTIVGDGTQSRDFTHIDDITDMSIAIIEKEIDPSLYGTLINVGAGNPYVINDVAAMISDKKIFIPERPGEAVGTKANSEKAKKYFGWEAKRNLADYIKQNK